LISKGGPEIARLTNQAKELGLIMSSEDAAAAAEFKDALYGLTQQVSFLIGSAFAPWLKEVTTGLMQLASNVSNFMKRNRDLVTGIVKVIGVVAAVGAALVVAGTLFTSIGAVIGGVMATITAVGAAFGVVTAAIGAIVSPVGIAVAGIVGLVGWFTTCTDAGKSMVSSLVGAFTELSNEAVASFGAITGAIQAGDIQSAWKVVTTFINLEWTKLTSSLLTTWATWKGYFLEMWNQVTSVFAHTWETAINGVATSFVGLWGALRVGWTEIVAFMQKG
jgi:hypothetical protein